MSIRYPHVIQYIPLCTEREREWVNLVVVVET